MGYAVAKADAPDVFVSYAHTDDALSGNETVGWVSRLVKDLGVALKQKLGDAGICIWSDRRMSPGERIDRELVDRAGRASTFLAVVSPSFVNSRHCAAELEAFLLRQGEDSSARRLLTVEIDALPRNMSFPESLENRFRLAFWERNSESGVTRTFGRPTTVENDPAYYERILRLAHHLSEALVALRPAETSVRPSRVEVRSSPTVYLARVTERLEQERTCVASFLENGGVRVFPDSSHRAYPADEAGYARSLSEDLGESVLFAQLLDELSGRHPAFSTGLVKLQAETARKVGIETIQWRRPELDLATVEDADHRRILTAATVQAVGLHDWQVEVRRLALAVDEAEPGDPERRSGPGRIQILAADEDEAIRRILVEELRRTDLAYNARRPRDLEVVLKRSDGVLVVYGLCGTETPEDLLERCEWLRFRGPQPPPVVAVCDGPPDEKPPLAIRLEEMIEIPARAELDLSALERFVSRVRTRARQRPRTSA